MYVYWFMYLSIYMYIDLFMYLFILSVCSLWIYFRALSTSTRCECNWCEGSRPWLVRRESQRWSRATSWNATASWACDGQSMTTLESCNASYNLAITSFPTFINIYINVMSEWLCKPIKVVMVLFTHRMTIDLAHQRCKMMRHRRSRDVPGETVSMFHDVDFRRLSD